ncbi:response regulator [uncultured Thiodictyon sp.]|uniref:response regulator n=1 Tax=uncultured Thiodictyon sp. TaxID=1846217 RepID=UPI0025EABA96|nr:response regulator [uncultured Thiodictyon sp.]
MTTDVAQRKILIIEDDADLLMLVRHVLEREGYRVFVASNGADGILVNEREDPDLILLDLRMPDMDGIETLRNIRECDKKVLVVILTGYGCPDTIREAADLKVSEYLSKPFANKDLAGVIGKALLP